MQADAAADRARKEAALAKVRETRAAQQAESNELRRRQASLVTKKKPRDDEDGPDGLAGAIERSRARPTRSRRS